MFFKKSKPAEALDPAVPQTEVSTATPSENVSVSDIEQEKEKNITTAAPDSRSIRSSDSRRKTETTGLDEAKALDHLEDEIVYPTGAKLAFITFALCISVFLMALVCDLDV
jgi:hypothetical protein